MNICGDKIFSAAKFIDYFVHDILDYTILNKDGKNFIKNPKIFDMRDAIEEIVVIQMDKIEMKQITIEKHFFGFTDEDFLVKTDIKRMQ